MIKRDKRNIGKLVKVNSPKSVFHGRIGKVIGFRGDHSKGNPYVFVFIYDLGKTTGSTWPFPSHILEKL